MSRSADSRWLAERAAHIVRRRFGHAGAVRWWDDLVGEAWLAIVAAEPKFDAGRPDRWDSFATTSAIRHLLKFARLQIACRGFGGLDSAAGRAGQGITPLVGPLIHRGENMATFARTRDMRRRR